MAYNDHNEVHKTQLQLLREKYPSIDTVMKTDNVDDVRESLMVETGKMGGPGGMKCTSCDWQGSCDELVDGKCPECGEDVIQVGREGGLLKMSKLSHILATELTPKKLSPAKLNAMIDSVDGDWEYCNNKSCENNIGVIGTTPDGVVITLDIQDIEDSDLYTVDNIVDYYQGRS